MYQSTQDTQDLINPFAGIGINYEWGKRRKLSDGFLTIQRGWLQLSVISDCSLLNTQKHCRESISTLVFAFFFQMLIYGRGDESNDKNHHRVEPSLAFVQVQSEKLSILISLSHSSLHTVENILSMVKRWAGDKGQPITKLSIICP